MGTCTKDTLLATSERTAKYRTHPQRRRIPCPREMRIRLARANLTRSQCRQHSRCRMRACNCSSHSSHQDGAGGEVSTCANTSLAQSQNAWCLRFWKAHRMYACCTVRVSVAELQRPVVNRERVRVDRTVYERAALLAAIPRFDRYRSVRVVVVGVNTILPGGINERQRIVPHVAIQVPTLRLVRILVRKRLALRPTVIPRPKVIEARLRIAFFGGTAGSSTGIVQASGYPRCGQRVSSGRTPM